jgi:hypothetical protein
MGQLFSGTAVQVGLMATIEIRDDAALVLFELLSRLDSRDIDYPLKEIRLEDTAELSSLRELHGALERALVAPLDERYKALLDDARTAVRRRWQDAK